ncbi:MAG: CaiB/BaiF CoA-transferase family protein [Eggerthellales bacterium]|nr:CaiB/BaiF CoA-transferase family protein [Eggerthellales bacterium]
MTEQIGTPAAGEREQFGPLQGVKVVSLCQAIAGPFACALLGDLGADVIGIENPKGRDTSRPQNEFLQGWGTQLDRRNSRSLCMDVRKGRGREIFFQLLKETDILVEGFRGGQMVKWDMSDETLWEVNPKLVIVHISGFGQTGDPDYVSRASFDGIGQAFSGYMEMNGFGDRLPVPAFPQPSDYFTGLFGDVAALAAFHRAQVTGKGESIDIAQFEAMQRVSGFYLMNYLNTGALPVREGSHSTSSAGYGAYTCSDGVPLYILVLGAGVVRNLLPVLGIKQGEDPLFPVGMPVVAFKSEAGAALEAKLDEFFASHTAAEAEEILLGAGVPCSRIYTFADCVSDPHYQAREVYTSWKNEYDDNQIKGINVIPRLKNNPGKITRGMPLVGQHNEEILESLGVSTDEIAQLYDQGTIRHEETPFG